MELPRADGKLIRAGQIENMKMGLSNLEGRRLCRPTNNLAAGRPSLQAVSLLITTIAAAAFCILPETADARDVIHKGDVVTVPLRGEVAPSLLAFWRRAVRTADSNEASAIIFEMNTYGGRLDTAADIVNVLNQTKIPTYTFINTNAGSAGAIIAIATQHIFMSPVSAVGDAAP